MGYWWEGPASTTMPPIPASNFVGQHKIGNITFQVTFVDEASSGFIII